MHNTYFYQNSSLGSKDNEQKQDFDINQGPLPCC